MIFCKSLLSCMRHISLRISSLPPPITRTRMSLLIRSIRPPGPPRVYPSAPMICWLSLTASSSALAALTFVSAHKPPVGVLASSPPCKRALFQSWTIDSMSAYVLVTCMPIFANLSRTSWRSINGFPNVWRVVAC